MDLLERLAKFSDSIRRHGGDFEDYLDRTRPRTGQLPTIWSKFARATTSTRIISTTRTNCATLHEPENKDLNLFEERQPARKMANGDAPEKVALRQNGSMPRRRARLVELHESTSVHKLIDELAKKGLKIEHYSNSDQPIFELIEGEGDKAHGHPLFAIPEILRKRSRNWPAGSCRSSDSKASVR